MKCLYHNGRHGECRPGQLDGKAVFVIGPIVGDAVADDSLTPVCPAHINTFAVDFLDRLASSLQLESDLNDIAPGLGDSYFRGEPEP